MNLARSTKQAAQADVSRRFTGTVHVAARFGRDDAHQGARIAFQPGARTAWHAHPVGQTLLVIEGAGRLQRDGGHIEPMRPGDIIWLEPGERHWHGAAPEHPVTLIALARAEPDANVVWMEQVSEEEYHGAQELIEPAPQHL